MDIFYFFCRYPPGKVRQFFFYQLQQILIVNKFAIWRKFKVTRSLFLRLLIVRTCGEESSCFLLKVSKLVNLSNRSGGESEKITISPFKRKSQQDQEKITKTNNNQIKPKQKKTKLKPK